MRPPALRRSCVVTAITFATLASATVHGQDNLRVSCLPDKAVASPRDVVSLNVWIASASGPVTGTVIAHWDTETGRVEMQSTAARWMLEGAPIDRRYTASVRVETDDGRAGSCSLGVWVTDPSPSDSVATPAGGANAGGRRRGEYITRRAFLRMGDVGEAGFGLYSYFLMREPVSAVDRTRAASFIGAFLDTIVGVAEQENYVERRRLNGSYLPVTLNPPQGLSAEQLTAWTLGHYDYEHAKRLLSLYPALTGLGPFIVAVPAPLRSPVKPMLPWDFSQVDSAAIDQGVSRFLNQAAQLYDWQNQGALPKLREQLLTAVAAMFVGRSAAESWMQIVR